MCGFYVSSPFWRRAVARHRSRAATVRRKRPVCDANRHRKPLSLHRKLLSHFAPYLQHHKADFLLFNFDTLSQKKQLKHVVLHLQKFPNVQASTAANQPLHTPIRPFTRASRPMSSLAGITEVVAEKNTERTTRLLLTNESVAMSHTPPRTSQLPSRCRQGWNGPGGGGGRTD